MVFVYCLGKLCLSVLLLYVCSLFFRHDLVLSKILIAQRHIELVVLKVTQIGIATSTLGIMA